MNKKQEEMMKKIKEMQKKNVKRNKSALYAGYIIMIFITSLISWLIWTLLASQIDGVPSLTYWQGMVYNLLVYSSILMTASVLRAIRKRKDA